MYIFYKATNRIKYYRKKINHETAYPMLSYENNGSRLPLTSTGGNDAYPSPPPPAGSNQCGQSESRGLPDWVRGLYQPVIGRHM